MGSEKKRKRVSTDAAEGVAEKAEKLERKRLRKEKKNKAENGADVATDAGSNVVMDVATGVATEVSEAVAPLVSPIASPMAGRKLTKKLLKLVSRAAKEKALRRGIKEVVLALRKKDTGIVVLAGDVFPVEVIAHLPVLCEEADIPYCFVPTKTELGGAGLTKRPTSVVLLSMGRAKDELKAEIVGMRKDVKEIQNLY